MRLLGGAAAEDEGMALRKAEEAATRRCEAARWLRQMAAAAVETLPERPSEEEFCTALRNGLILCKVLNRVNPGAIPKVVENPTDAVQSSDGAAQSAIQYFENMRNFLVAVSEMNLLTFEASDIEKGGSSMKVVDCILCLKAYHEWKLSGGIGIWRYGAIVKIAPSSKRLPLHSSRFGGSADQNQQMLEFVHLLSEVSLEETRVEETQHSLFQQFVLRVVRAFLLEWSEADKLPLDDMVLETILERYKRTLRPGMPRAPATCQAPAAAAAAAAPAPPPTITAAAAALPCLLPPLPARLSSDFVPQVTELRSHLTSGTAQDLELSSPPHSRPAAPGPVESFPESPPELQCAAPAALGPLPPSSDPAQAAAGPDLEVLLAPPALGRPVQVRSLLRKLMKDESGVCSKLELIEAISKSLKETTVSLSSPLQLPCDSRKCLDGGGGLERQQEELEKLKLSFNDMKSQVESTRAKWEEDLTKLESYFEAQNHNAYHKLLEENRKLYNQVQDLKGSIRVYCRVKPFPKTQPDQRSTVDHIGENGEIMIMNPEKQGKDGRKIFSFNKIFGPNVSQSEVFADTQPLIRSVMDGYNVCIFAYGQTGSGKTYTMSGPDITEEETLGVNYRSLNDLFNISQNRSDTTAYDVRVQMIEIYNEQVRDLLMTDGSSKRLEIRNNSHVNGLNIPDANLVPVKCTQDVLDLMKLGHRNRAVGSTALNERSSRSHSVLTVHVQGKEIISGSTLRGCLHLVDLAGSERVDKSEAAGERLTEAKHINKSLSALGDVIAALAQKCSHVPYRNSKLTQVLQDALGGQAKTLMFVHVNPEADAFGETVSTLKFAERVATIELGAARANKEGAQVKDLKEEIGKLKSALDEKEREAAQLKDVTNRVGSETRNARARSPMTTSLRLKPEARQDSSVDTCTSEIRSSSSGKQRRFRSPLSVQELDDKSPVISRELYFSSRKFKTPSPPVRSSFSSERSGTAITVEKTESIMECTPTPKVEPPAKAPHGSSARKTPASILTEQSLRKFRDSEENRSAKPPVRESMTKSRLDSARKEGQQQQQTSGAKVRSEARIRKNWSDMENEFGSSEPTFHSCRSRRRGSPRALI